MDCSRRHPLLRCRRKLQRRTLHRRRSGGIRLAAKGRCGPALPILKRAAAHLTDKQLKYRAVMSTARCAMNLLAMIPTCRWSARWSAASRTEAPAKFSMIPAGTPTTSFASPDRVVLQQQSIKVNGTKMQLDLPSLSVTTIIGPIG